MKLFPHAHCKVQTADRHVVNNKVVILILLKEVNPYIVRSWPNDSVLINFNVNTHRTELQTVFTIVTKVKKDMFI